MRRRVLAWVVLVALLAGALVLLAGGGGPSGASALSRTSGGLFAARRYVEERGREVVLLDRPFVAAGPTATLVTAFPASMPVAGEELGEINAFLRHGGRLVLAYSGDEPGSVEAEVLASLGLETAAPRGHAPLAPLRWREWVGARWRLTPPQASEPRLVLRAPRRVPEPPPGSTVWFRAEDGTAVVFAFRVGAGRVVVLPRALLSNGALGEADNAELLEGLVGAGAGPWIFDEFLHGLVGASVGEEGQGSLLAFDLLLAHGVLVYLGAILAMGRRFGEPWREAAPLRASTAAFLRSLGVVHHELRHHREAAEALLARARELEPRMRVDDELVERSKTVKPSQFVAFARAVAERQRKAGRDS